jgi:hypothetical protein
MPRSAAWVAIWLLAVQVAFYPAIAQANDSAKAKDAALWKSPGDVKALNLLYGPGGKKHRPLPPVKFLKEDMHGTSPKFDVRDQDGKKWKAKLGPEARPETVASRLLWAMGYGANENYFFSSLKVEGLPAQLQRGQSFDAGNDEVKAVRLQRHPGGEKKEGNWSWRQNPFAGTREFNGLRVMMALLNNWDLKDENNAIFDDPSSPGRELYEVTDVGATFGKSGKSYTNAQSKGNLKAYAHSKFIARVTPKYVDFNFPTRSPWLYFLIEPRFFWHQMHVRWVGRHIPRADAKWIGSLLAQLSPEQIRDAFRAADYSQDQVEAYASAVEARIKELNEM